MFNGEISFYGILTAVGLLVSVLVIFLVARKKKDLYVDDLVFCGLWIAVAAFIGAHLVFFFVNLPAFIEGLSTNPPIDLGDFFVKLYRAASGLVYYGGCLGGLLGCILYVRRRQLVLRPYMNIFVLVFPLFHAFGRIGCVLSGCCYGIEYHGIFAIQYPASVIIEGVNDHICDVTRFPVQPLEAAIEVLIFVLLLVLYLKKGNKIALVTPYLVIYAVVRFLDEFLRGDTYRGLWGPFSTSQWIALIVLIATGIYYLVKWKTRKKKISI